MYDYGSPENRRINGRQGKNRIIWSTDPWKWKRIVFLSAQQGGCAWCGCIPSVVAHPPNSETYGTPDYLDFAKARCYPLCLPCARAEYRGKILCPRCRRQGHYCAPDDVCWDCKPEEVRERILYLRDKRKRDRAASGRKRYQQYHPKKVIRNGVWVTISKKPSTSTSFRS